MVEYLTKSLHCDPNIKLHDQHPLEEAAISGCLDIVKFLLDCCNCNLNGRGHFGRVLIHFAAEHGHLKLVKYLIEEKSCDPSVLDGKGFTPLQLAAGEGHLNVVRYLALEHACNPLYIAQGVDSRNAFGDAAFSGHVSVVRFFVEELKCDPNARDGNGRSLIHYACHNGHLKVKCVVEGYGCDPESSVDTLYRAISRGHQLLVKYLIEWAKGNSYCIHMHGPRENIALHTAATYMKDTWTSFAISSMSLEWTRIQPIGPLSFAAIRGHLAIVQYLLEIRRQDHHKYLTPLHYMLLKVAISTW